MRTFFFFLNPPSNLNPTPRLQIRHEENLDFSSAGLILLDAEHFSSGSAQYLALSDYAYAYL